MRIQYALVVLLIVVLATAFPITGQDDPLPSVTPRGTVIGEVPLIALASYPIPDAIQQPVERLSLSEAARANDYATFDALYREARQRGESVAQYATLHELWTWALNDPIGAFYGREMHDRLARAYPGFAQFIADYQIVDDHGNAYWPTSETRAFLLDQVKQGRAPRVLVAEGTTTVPRTERSESPRAERDAARSTAPTVERSTARSADRGTVPSTAPSAAPRANRTTAPSAGSTATRSVERSAGVSAGRSAAVPRRHPVANNAKSAEPPVAIAAKTAPATTRATTPAASTATPAPPPSQAAARDAVAPARVDASAPIGASAPADAGAPAVAPVAAPIETTAAPKAADSGSNARGLLLLVIGIIGIGMLAIMLRAPRETAPASIITPAQPPVAPPVEEKPKPVAVEPLKPADPKSSDSKPRASGSRG